MKIKLFISIKLYSNKNFDLLLLNQIAGIFKTKNSFR